MRANSFICSTIESYGFILGTGGKGQKKQKQSPRLLVIWVLPPFTILHTSNHTWHVVGAQQTCTKEAPPPPLGRQVLQTLEAQTTKHRVWCADSKYTQSINVPAPR